MKVRLNPRLVALTSVSVLLATLAVGAPLINAGAGPPRAVFLQLPAEIPEPNVALMASRGAAGHWLLEIDASDFQFTNLCVSDADAAPVGHAHIIRNGEKIASAYDPIVDLGPLPAGRHRITVVLRGQDHRALVGQAGLISADITLYVPRL